MRLPILILATVILAILLTYVNYVQLSPCPTPRPPARPRPPCRPRRPPPQDLGEARDGERAGGNTQKRPPSGRVREGGAGGERARARRTDETK